LQHNPFTPQLRALQASIERAQSRRRALLEQIAWYERFDPDEAHSRLVRGQRAVRETRKRIDTMQEELSAQATAIDRIAEVASLGFDPRYWFSSERAAAKQQLATLKADAAQRIKAKADLESHIVEREQAFKVIKADIERHRTFDLYLTNATVRALVIEIGEMEPKLAELSTRNDELNALLHEPVLRLSELERKRDRLNVEIDQARRLLEELNAADNSYERAKIHERCETMFGDGKPSRVASDRRAKLNAVMADIKKLTARVDQIVLRAQRVIRTVIIDGNNLCYQQDKFIGLVALQRLVPELTKRYDVTVVFDAGIRGLLRLNNSEIRGHFPDEVSVHAVASKAKADETILDAASGDRHCFVISNDRYSDYPDKGAVKEQRVLRHEVFNDVVHIHDLNVSVAF
jgi:uncharacterized coiled-coil DUF342 family protein